MIVDSETEFVNACRSRSPEGNLQPESEKDTTAGASPDESAVAGERSAHS